MTATNTHRAIETVWKIESPRLTAGLARIVRDVGLAKQLAQDALVAALQQWPEDGVPRNPGAWLMATAKHRAIDLRRRNKLLDASTRSSCAILASNRRRRPKEIETTADDDFGDDLLRLVFTALSSDPAFRSSGRPQASLTRRSYDGGDREGVPCS